MNGKMKHFVERLPRFINAVVGIWLMAMPSMFGYSGSPAATSDRIIGPFIVCFSVVAIWEATRAVRWANLPLAVWAVIAPFLLSGYPVPGLVGSICCGLVVGVCSFLGGKIHQRFGRGWSDLFRKTPEEELLASRQ